MSKTNHELSNLNDCFLSKGIRSYIVFVGFAGFACEECFCECSFHSIKERAGIFCGLIVCVTDFHFYKGTFSAIQCSDFLEWPILAYHLQHCALFQVQWEQRKVTWMQAEYVRLFRSEIDTLLTEDLFRQWGVPSASHWQGCLMQHLPN